MNGLLNFKNWVRMNEANSIMEDDGGLDFKSTFPDYLEAAKVFKAAFAKNLATANYAGNYHYYYVSKYTAKDSADGSAVAGYQIKIKGLGIRKYSDGYIVDVSSAESNEEVVAYWDPIKGLFSSTNWHQLVNTKTRAFMFTPYTTSSIEDISNINNRFNSIPLEKLKVMLTKYPNISNLAAKVKAGDPNLFKALTGNAKAIYEAGVLSTPASTPAKKP
jgi:hypothetical protein